MKTQKQKVIDKLLANGEITNLWAIEHHMLRLGAIIKLLRDTGWQIDGDFLPGTKNFCYRLVNRPLKQKSIFEEVFKPDGTIARREVRIYA